MRIKEMLEGPRLPENEEIGESELKERGVKFEEKSNEDLIRIDGLIARQIKMLDKEHDRLRYRADEVRRGYKYTAGDPGDPNFAIPPTKGKLEEFRDAKNNLKESLEGTKISPRVALTTPRFAPADEVKHYNKNRVALRNAVGELLGAKKELGKSMERFGGVSFRASERGATLDPKKGKVALKQAELAGSVRALALEHEHVTEILKNRAKGFWQGKKNVSTNDLVLAAGEFGIEGSTRAAVTHEMERMVEERKQLGSRSLNDFPPNFEADAIVGCQKDIKSAVTLGEGRNILIKIEELKHREEKISGSLAGLRSQRVGVAVEMLQKFGKELNKLPLNIEVGGEKGGPEAYATEGPVKASAWNYEGFDELNAAKLELEAQITESHRLSKEFSDANYEHKNNKSRTPARIYNLELRREYKKVEESIEQKKRELDEIDRNINALQTYIGELKKKVKVTKELVDVEAYVGPLELNHHLYIHDNYGRGFKGARAKDPVQTVGDFFDYFEGQRKTVLLKVQKERAVLEAQPLVQAYIKVARELDVDFSEYVKYT